MARPERKRAQRRSFLLGTAALAIFPSVARPQRRLWRIGYHSAGSAESNAGWLDAFRKGMADLGWSEARDYVIDARYADGSAAAVPRLAAELVATQPDVVLTTAEASILALLRSTKNVPVVFALAADPVSNGFAKSLQRPGGNATGLTLITSDLAGKRLELLKEAFPQTAHVLVLFEPADAGGVSQVKGIQAAATRLNVRLRLHEVHRNEDIEAAFQASGPASVDACIIVSAPMMIVQRRSIAAHLLKAKLPSITSNVTFVEAGVMMGYAGSPPANFQRAATYVDKILKGAKAAELAIEQPTKFDLVINLRTAKTLGLAIPQSLRLRADRIIE